MCDELEWVFLSGLGVPIFKEVVRGVSATSAGCTGFNSQAAEVEVGAFGLCLTRRAFNFLVAVTLSLSFILSILLCILCEMRSCSLTISSVTCVSILHMSLSMLVIVSLWSSNIVI